MKIRRHRVDGNSENFRAQLERLLLHFAKTGGLLWCAKANWLPHLRRARKFIKSVLNCTQLGPCWLNQNLWDPHVPYSRSFETIFLFTAYFGHFPRFAFLKVSWSILTRFCFAKALHVSLISSLIPCFPLVSSVSLFFETIYDYLCVVCFKGWEASSKLKFPGRVQTGKLNSKSGRVKNKESKWTNFYANSWASIRFWAESVSIIHPVSDPWF